MDKKMLDRINELAKKKKEQGLPANGADGSQIGR